jgi:hypothetical protein
VSTPRNIRTLPAVAARPAVDGGCAGGTHRHACDMAGEDLLDEALHALGTTGVTFEDPAVVDLLRAAEVLCPGAGPRTRLRAAIARKILCEVPAAWGLFDRAGRKTGTVAGGEAAHRASLLPLVILEPVSAPSDLPASLAEAIRCQRALHRLSGPLLVQGVHADGLDPLCTLLAVLRGSAREAEGRPPWILEVAAACPSVWDPRACHLLMYGARRGIPLAVAPAVDMDATERDRLIGIAADGVAAAIAQQLARRQASLAWVLPPLTADGTSGVGARAWHALACLTEHLEIPALAIASGDAHAPLTEPGGGAALAAALAAACGVALLAVHTGAGASAADTGTSTRVDALFAHLDDLREILSGPPPGALEALRRRSAGAAGTHAWTGSGRGGIDLALSVREALEQVVLSEAKRHGIALSALPMDGCDA